ncbi:MAG TPA: DUF2911 domain-containing protein [Cyclobacteriaceae bacterium]|nr:DUF2911 domain-containing protein [Cyclobacteriaceae bacterium]
MKYFASFILVALGIAAYGQQSDTTRGSIPSQAELLLGKIGVRIQYYAPAVRGRVIWGGLVTYDQVWVTGAHRATTLEVNTSVEIGGKELKPGKYALFTIPGKDQWTVILNKNWDQHLADEYSEAEDVVRFTVSPQVSNHRERLKYSLEKINEMEVKATIHWEKISVNFPIKLLSAKAKYKLPKSKGPGLTSATPAHEHGMSHAFSQSLPMNRNGSGTGWLPDNTPMYAWMKQGEKWNSMLHGEIFIRQNWQNINNQDAGENQFDVPGWVMGMTQRKMGRNGLLLLRAMISIDPVTVGGDGYPLLFQTGETYKGEPLVNRQHPHDFFSELAVGYTQRFSDDVDFTVYFGYPGEPALGPTAFMHRISSLNNPNAPLGHHWQDATHIVFGVATAGLRYKNFKLEGSSFTGREPDEHRFNFDKAKFDSYSYRLSYAPSKSIVIQASKGFIKSPEELEPDEDVDRTTASVIFSGKPLNEKTFTAAAVFGYNDSGPGHKESSLLVEANYQVKKVNLLGRYEWVEKSDEELQIIIPNEEIFPIHSLTGGITYQLGSWLKTDTAIGVQGTFNFIPTSLEPIYGNTPFSLQAFIRIVPRMMVM